MYYFTQALHQQIANDIADSPDSPLNQELEAYQKFMHLYEQLASRIEASKIDLHTLTKANQPNLTQATATSRDPQTSICLQFFRTKTQAVQVERLMGRDHINSRSIDPRRHPVLELRLTEPHFAVELVLSPDAWWDQQNVKGKLSIERYSQELYDYLRNLPHDYCIGYWRGTELKDLHVTIDQLPRPHILRDWISTFSPGKDWFRIGIWYEPESLMEADGADEIYNQLKALYQVYESLLWTSDNNFREFETSAS